MAASTRPFEARDITRIRIASDPQVSPDGKHVAFTVTTASEELDAYHSTIWLASTAGGSVRQLTTGDRHDSSPRWSPEGTRLAFVSDRGEKKKPQLYVLPLGGGEAQAITSLKQGVSEPVWSPDGSAIAFIARVGGWEEPEDPKEREKSKPARVITTLKYKWNGEGFTYDRRPHVFVVDASGGEPKQVTDGDFADGTPTWTSDSAHLVFASARHADADFDNAVDLWKVPVQGGELTRLTNTQGPLAEPVISPSGDHVAYLGTTYLNETGRNTRVFVISAAGGDARCLTNSLDRTVTSACWIPDGTGLLLTVDEHGAVPVYHVTLDGTATRIIDGDRQVTGLSVASRESVLAFTAKSPASPSEVYVCALDGSGERHLTTLNSEWMSQVALSSPEHFTVERAGHSVDVWVMKPASFEAGKRYPTLLNVHGGPAAQYGYDFFDEFHVQTGAGYAVVYTNPRGSQGSGEDFCRAVVGDWGHGDYDDVMTGLDEALRRCDFIDPDRLGVLGGSYGGFMTSWIVGHTHLFKAACSERALNTFTSFFGTSDIGPFFTEAHSGGLPWDNAQWLVEHSPLTYAKDIQTPLLVMHSEQDWRCPIEQGEQLYIALRRQRKPVKFIRFPDESHELSRSGKPRHRIERFDYIVEWFNSYLKIEQ